MVKGGKIAKKKTTRAKKEPEKKIDQRAMIEAVGSLLEAQALMSRATAHMKSAANVINAELSLGLDTKAMTAYESQHYTRPEAPLKVGAVPKPVNGELFTAEELGNPGVMTRRVLTSILSSLGGDATGKMPPALRTAIMEAQGGRKEIGTCEFTGDEDVPTSTWFIGDDEYTYGPKVAKLLSGKGGGEARKILQQLVEGEIEV